MTTKTKLVPEKIQIADFRIINGHVECPFEFSDSDVEKFQSNFEFDMAFNHEKKLVKADLKINIITHSKGQVFNEAKSNFHIVFVYHVDNLEELLTINPETNHMTVDGGLSNAIASISFSTSRGILMTRLQGTSLRKFIMPVISPNNLLSKGKILA
ncbi:MAG: hypothetical protein IPK08_14275 [Bacteroidetes bacterium]|nr:hypothetical protein [Bacteroidota bacterium]